MTSRRQFLQTASVGAAGAMLGTALQAADVPTLGMIFPPANYPVPPEATLLYPSGIRFLAEGVGLQKMTAEEYDRVFGKIMPAAQKLAKEGSNAISVMGTSLTFYKGAEYEGIQLEGERDEGHRAAIDNHEHWNRRGTEGAERQAGGRGYGV